MGKGDKKTKRGKIIQGSYGVTRKRARKVAAEKNDRRRLSVAAGEGKVTTTKVEAEVESSPESAEDALAKAAKKKAAAKSVKKTKDEESTSDTVAETTEDAVLETPEATEA